MKHKIHPSIITAIGIIAVIFLIGSYIYGLFTNTTEAIASIAFMFVCGVLIFVGYA